MSLTTRLKKSLPAPLKKGLRQLLNRLRGQHTPLYEHCFSGPYSSWQEAVQHSDGYDEKSILDKTLKAALQVKQGLAVYERDSVIFDSVQVPRNQLSAFQHILKTTGQRLHVIDFGGSLGTSYFLASKILKGITDLKWAIVEQKHYVAAGNQYIAGPQLAFYNTLQEAARSLQPDLLLVSGSIQYVENAYTLLEQMRDMNLPYILFDRTLFTRRPDGMVAVQRAAESIYKGSYPCHFFNEAAFLRIFEGKYELVMQYDSDYDAPDMLQEELVQMRGMLLARL
jgi:putative methyltransferase (TIGR04325 family)